MSYSPMLTVHICGGALGLLSVAAALAFRKGSRRHVLAGRIFVASMLTMGAAAVCLAVVRHQPNNIGGGILTVYLIGTAWLTVRRRPGETSWFDWIALLIPLAIGVLGWKNGLDALHSPTGEKYDVPAAMHLFMGTICLLAATGDVRILVRGGVFGAKRIARHLAHVLWAVHRSRVLFLWTVEPAPEIAFVSGYRATPTRRFIRHKLVFSPHPAPSDFAALLALPSTLRNGEKLYTT